MLGKTLRCRVTGFTGIATSKVEYLNGCSQYCLKPKMADGNMPEGEYIDTQQLVIVDDGVFLDIVMTVTGGDMSDPPTDTYIG